MARWPDEAELKQVLNVEGEDWDDQLDRLMEAAIARVKRDVGNWDEDVDVVTNSLAQAALRMAVLMVPNAPTGDEDPGQDAAYRRLLFGSRRKFGVA
jgi:acetoin utilization deacetylase AcuC-like enzyme